MLRRVLIRRCVCSQRVQCASAGVLGDAKQRRWCGSCSQQHEGAHSMRHTRRMCEDCGLKHANYGVVGDTKKTRWCAGCSRQHEGSRNMCKAMCED